MKPRIKTPRHEYWDDRTRRLEFRHDLKELMRIKTLLTKHGMQAVHYGKYRYELQDFFQSNGLDHWPEHQIVHWLDDCIELYQGLLKGKLYYDIENEKLRHPPEIRPSEPETPETPEPPPEEEDPLGTLAKRLAKQPVVDSLHARIERTPDGKTVLLYLNLSKRERNIVLQHHLYEKTYEDGPAYTQEELEEFQAAFDTELNEMDANEDFTYEDLRDREREITREMRELKAERKNYTLLDYLLYPYTRDFPTGFAATQYIDKLQKIIDRIRLDIITYADVEDVRETKS